MGDFEVLQEVYDQYKAEILQEWLNRKKNGIMGFLLNTVRSFPMKELGISTTMDVICPILTPILVRNTGKSQRISKKQIRSSWNNFGDD